MIAPHKIMPQVLSSRFFLTIFLVVLVVAAFRVPALEGEKDSDIVVTLSDSSYEKTVFPRGADSSIADGVKFTIEPSPKTVDVSTTFDIEIWLRNVQQPINGYTIGVNIGPPEFIELIDVFPDDLSFPITGDVRIVTVRLHCLGVGTVTVDFQTSLVIIDSAQFSVTGVNGVIHQIATVGGITTPINKLEILTPYISLAGLIAAVSTIYIKKRRH